jgi:2-oxoglutarate dehydrogenase E2 component (dihydrolipoamide succinyltransferase)
MAIEIVVPDLGESVVEATVANWLKQEGDPVKAGEPLVSLETDKVDLEVPAPQDGVLGRIRHPAGDDVRVGEALATLETDGAAASQAEQPEPEAATAPPTESQAPTSAAPAQAPPAEEEQGSATPVAKRMAQDKGVDLASVEGAGPGGRVTKRDVEEYLARQEQGTPASGDEGASDVETPVKAAPAETESKTPTRYASTADGRGEERIRMSRRRRTIAERLVEAQRTAAMLTTFNEVDMTAVMEMRQRKRDEFKKRHGVSLGFMSFFVKASVAALRSFPRVNASIEEQEIVLKRYYDIGIAVGAEEGLVVPVLRDADRMSFAEIEQSIGELAEKAKSGTLTLDELRGGTFTISNGGVFGSMLSTPILNPPQVGILGLHKIEPRPVVVNGEIVVRNMMYLALSYDHRIIDGSEAVRFLVQIKQLIEDPEEMLLAG